MDEEQDSPAPKKHYAVAETGIYVALLTAEEAAPRDDLVEVTSAPSREDQTWSTDQHRWVYPSRHYADDTLHYYDEVEEGTAPKGFLIVPSAPSRADQFWNGARWEYPHHHYADSEGVYLDVFEEGTEPDGAQIVTSAPDNAEDQRWRNGRWQWQTHYWRDAAGNFLGASDLPAKPEGAIEVSADALPAHGAMKFTHGAWAHTREFIGAEVRRERDERLAASDTLVWPDRWAGYSDAERAAIAVYRQALRDVPSQEGFPDEVVWPEMPA